MPYTEFHYTPTGTGVISGKEVLEQTEDAINDLGGQISGDVQTAIDTANNALNTANTASADAQNAVNTANTAYTTATNAQNTANAAQNTASNALTAAQNAQNDVNALGNRVTTAENNITQNTTDISGLTTRMGTAENNITTLQNDVVTAQATANSAQQTATTARQQSYVFRYSSIALTASSTNSNALLDNTDNLKVGDKVIDSSGVIYSVTAIDTANSTFTVGTALIDLAQDSDVVHKSGNETVGGNKTFSNTPVIYNSDTSGSTANLYLRNQLITKGDTSSSGNQTIRFADVNDKLIGRIQSNKVSNGASSLNLRAETIDAGNNDVTVELQILSGRDGSKSFSPQVNNSIDLGRTLAKWKNLLVNQINGLTPSSLGMPANKADSIDISSYFTNTGTAQTNEYTVPANGYIYLQLSNIVTIHCFAFESASTTVATYIQTFSSGNDGQLYVLFPVRKNDVFKGTWYTSTTVTVSKAMFIPCQGNV